MRVAIPLAGLLVILHGTVAQAGSGVDRAVSFLASQGCAIGPSTRVVAANAGIDPRDIEELAKSAREGAQSVETGEWLVLPSTICTIVPPSIEPVLKLTDPVVRESITSIDAYAASGELGCFLNGDALFKALRETRG